MTQSGLITSSRRIIDRLQQHLGRTQARLGTLCSASQISGERSNVCHIGQNLNGTCDDLVVQYSHEGNRYCVLHYPHEGKGQQFRQALDAKLANGVSVDLRGVWVPTEYASYFRGQTFAVPIDFSTAVFKGSMDFFEAQFNSVSFRNATFCKTVTFSSKFCKDAVFDHATFCEAAGFRDSEFRCGTTYFIGTQFCEEASFSDAKFEGDVSFNRAVFHADALFDSTNFGGNVDFQQVAFLSQAAFRGTVHNRVFHPEKRINFRHAEIEDPTCVSFHTVTVRPGWFVDANPREFSFTNVEWYRLCSWRRLWTINDELEVVKRLGAPSPASILEGTCRELAINSEEDHLYGEASKFRYHAMDARRRRSKGGSWGTSLIFWYWLLSGYGELQGRSLVWLSLILFGFAGLYTLTGLPQDKVVTWSNVVPSYWQSLVYSLGIMTRQRLTLQPETGLVQFLVILEGILGPLQIALFALAIRRKFIK
jgi:uncharacterized protein YjbI with pentapeptide repeats